MRAIPSSENILLYVSGHEGHSYMRAIHTYIMGFHTHQNQTYCTFTVMRAIHAYVIPVLGFSGMDYSTLKSFPSLLHFVCRFTALFRSCVLPFGPLTDHCYDVQVRFVLLGDCMFKHPMRAFMEWMRGRKAHKTYSDRAAILFGGDHLGGAPEYFARLLLVSLGSARGEA